ncbi:MAG TPA: AmmeMemoRadiSam system protein A [Vicinamibacterales bacterium]|nr:AmmeMemoRadiSam system protein A [Vicinamibacterales bacterium]
MLDAAARIGLLQRARTAIARAVGAESEERVTEPAHRSQAPVPDDFRAGAFVTLRVNGALRGCIGYPEPDRPLIETIERCAVSAAISDPRFPALSRAEWDAVELEISVLGPIEPVADISDVVVGQHGLIVQYGHRRGLLLPQVATEWKWNAEELASQTCIKAGLPRDAWQKGGTLYRFEADVFGETFIAGE